MCRHNEKQLQFKKFEFMVGGKLRSDNRRVNLAQQIPWEDIEDLYASSFAGTGQRAPARSVRIAPGALIIKERLRMSDEETVEQIKENPYPQDFPGFKQYEDKAVFYPTLFVHFRKRFLEDIIIIRNNNLIAENALSEKKNRKNSDEGDDAPGAGTKIKALKKLAHQDDIDRIAIEGKFGQGKRRYRPDRIMTKLDACGLNVSRSSPRPSSEH
jgi:hypothetical protein